MCKYNQPQKLRNAPQSVSSLLTSIPLTILGLLLHVYDSWQGRHGWINGFLHNMWPLLTRYHSPLHCDLRGNIGLCHCRWCPVHSNEDIERYDGSKSQGIHILGVIKREIIGSSSGCWDERREGICLPTLLFQHLSVASSSKTDDARKPE